LQFSFFAFRIFIIAQTLSKKPDFVLGRHMKKQKTIPVQIQRNSFSFATRLQNCEMKSNRAGLGCANPNKVPEGTNSFLADDAKLALSKFWPRNEQAKTNKCGTRRILLSLHSLLIERGLN
jgi:hypothetical protein